MRQGRRLHPFGVLNGLGAHHHPVHPKGNPAVEDFPVAHATAHAYRNANGFQDFFNSSGVFGAFLESAVQIHYVKPRRSQVLPVEGHGRRIVAVNRLGVGPPLGKPDAAPVPDVNCGNYNHLIAYYQPV